VWVLKVTAGKVNAAHQESKKTKLISIKGYKIKKGKWEGEEDYPLVKRAKWQAMRKNGREQARTVSTLGRLLRGDGQLKEKR